MDDSDDKKLSPSRKIMLAAVSSLFAVAMFIVTLLLIARCLQNRQERRRRTYLHSLRAQMSPVEGNTTQPPKQGLNPSVIASLPILVYNQTNEPIECSVCLGTIAENTNVRLLPNCNHMFHVECIDMWFASHANCPICRALAEPRVQPEVGEVGGSTVEPTAPPMDLSGQDGASRMDKEGASEPSGGSRVGSFRRMLSRERSRRARNTREDEVCVQDSERA